MAENSIGPAMSVENIDTLKYYNKEFTLNLLNLPFPSRCLNFSETWLHCFGYFSSLFPYWKLFGGSFLYIFGILLQVTKILFSITAINKLHSKAQETG